MRASVDLPLPVSPTIPSDSPSLHLQRHVVDRRHLAEPAAQQHAAREREALDEPLDGGERRRARSRSSRAPCAQPRPDRPPLRLRQQARDAVLRRAPRAAPAPGSTVRWRSRTYGQRGWKRQPDGGSTSDGGRPGIGTSSAPSGASSRGIERSSPHVYGCCGAANSSRRGRLLDDPPGVHDGDLVGRLGDHAEVVRDQHHRHPQLVAQPAQQREDLRLDGHVQRGRRLVGDQHARLVRERHRDHRALAHAARQLVRVGVDAPARVGDRDQLEQLDRASARRRARDTRRGARAPPPRSARRRAAAGAAPTAGPGRPSRSRRRAARRRRVGRRRQQVLAVEQHASGHARARTAHRAPSRSSPRPSCRSRTRRRSRACGRARPRTRRRRPPARARRACRTRRAGPRRARPPRLRRRAHASAPAGRGTRTRCRRRCSRRSRSTPPAARSPGSPGSRRARSPRS